MENTPSFRRLLALRGRRARPIAAGAPHYSRLSYCRLGQADELSMMMGLSILRGRFIIYFAHYFVALRQVDSASVLGRDGRSAAAVRCAPARTGSSFLP